MFRQYQDFAGWAEKFEAKMLGIKNMPNLPAGLMPFSLPQSNIRLIFTL
jgi:hypothetical protein